jgi:flagellar motor protein MotB
MAHVKIKNMISTSDPRVCMIGHPAPAWMVNYADLMTELVCFFIIMYAMAAALNKDVVKAKKEVEQAMKAEGVSTEVKVTKDGMTITLEENGENVFFESGAANISPRMMEILAKLTPALKGLAKSGHDIIVEGHTDNVPIHTLQFGSNWELSTARATCVVQHMIQRLQMPPPHMGAIGYGEFHPLVANDTDEHRARNRRVVFFVKNAPLSADTGKGKKKKEVTEPVAEQAPPDAMPAETAPDSASQPAANEPSAASEIQTPAEPTEQTAQ